VPQIVCLVTRLVILQRSPKHDRRHQSVPLDPDNTVMSLIAGIRALVIEIFYSAYVHHPQILSQCTFSGISDIGPSLNNHSKRRKHGWVSQHNRIRHNWISQHISSTSLQTGSKYLSFLIVHQQLTRESTFQWRITESICTPFMAIYSISIADISLQWREHEEILCDLHAAHQGVTSIIFRDNACYHISQDWM
jgi:hypothetical protein